MKCIFGIGGCNCLGKLEVFSGKALGNPLPPLFPPPMNFPPPAPVPPPPIPGERQVFASYDAERDPEEVARGLKLRAVFPKPNELFLDFDTQKQWECEEGEKLISGGCQFGGITTGNHLLLSERDGKLFASGWECSGDNPLDDPVYIAVYMLCTGDGDTIVLEEAES